jgi:hypothetical protein
VGWQRSEVFDKVSLHAANVGKTLAIEELWDSINI